MDGWMDGWMDVCMDGWMDGCMYGCVYASMCVCMYVSMYICIYGWVDKWMHGWMHACIQIRRLFIPYSTVKTIFTSSWRTTVKFAVLNKETKNRQKNITVIGVFNYCDMQKVNPITDSLLEFN